MPLLRICQWCQRPIASRDGCQTPTCKTQREKRHQRYDANQRNPVTAAFYNSATWRVFRKAIIADRPLCERCLKEGRGAWTRLHVHHKKEITTPDGWAARLDPAGVVVLCHPCHNRVR